VLKAALSGGLAALVLCLAPAGSAATHKGAPASQVKRFVVHGVYTREQRSLLVRQGFDIGEAYWADHVELYGTDAQARRLSLYGMRVHRVRLTPDDFPPPDSNYHNYAEMVADIQAVAAARPSIVHIFSLGTSYEGRDIIGARISDDANDNLSEPGVFFVGQHHAREHLTVEVVLSLLHMFAGTTPTATSEVSNLVRTRQIYIVPSLNPDGAEYDIAGGSYSYWRKNRQPNSDAVGTDNNRNYSYKWGCCGGSDGWGGGETYRGPSPLSAPENQRMHDFMVAHPNVKTGISYHTYGELVLYPYGYTYTDEPPDMDHVDHQTFMAMGAEMERTTGYHAQQSSDLYITDGDWNDWMYGELHRYPITIEMAGYGYGFYPPDEYIPVEIKRNWRAAIFDAKIADCPRRIVGGTCG
jgi:carboxypeptidase T